MPSVINLGFLNVNSPQPNSAFIVGQSVINGMDANRKYNLNIGGIYGFANAITGNLNTNFDNFEMIDGPIFDGDIKPNIGGNV